jgi:hypothetical protein
LITAEIQLVGILIGICNDVNSICLMLIGIPKISDISTPLRLRHEASSLVRPLGVAQTQRSHVNERYSGTQLRFNVSTACHTHDINRKKH